MGLMDRIKGERKSNVQGISLDTQGARWACTHWEKDRLRIDHLEQIPILSQDRPDISKALHTAGISADQRMAMLLRDPGVIWKKIVLPTMANKDIKDALRWQLLEDLPQLEGDLEIRYFPFSKTNSTSGKREFSVFGMASDTIEKLRQHYLEIGLKIVIAEPLAISLTAWLDFLNPDPYKVRAILYFREGQGDFVGLKGSQLLDWQSFTFSYELHLGEGPAVSTLGVRFHDYLDSFLSKNSLEKIEEIYLAGDWDAPNPEETLSTLFGIPTFRLGEANSKKLLFAEEGMAERVLRFAPELALCIHPGGKQ